MKMMIYREPSKHHHEFASQFSVVLSLKKADPCKSKRLDNCLFQYIYCTEKNHKLQTNLRLA